MQIQKSNYPHEHLQMINSNNKNNQNVIKTFLNDRLRKKIFFEIKISIRKLEFLFFL